MPHKAIWVHADATQEIKTIAGDYHPPKGDLLLKTICVALNPGDSNHPENLRAVNTVEGFDAVGKVVGIGRDTPGFKIGDKVLTFARGIGGAEWGASQEYFLALAATSWKFDYANLSEKQAAAIPLTLFTACCALYNRLRPPLPLPWDAGCGSPILLWGASSQVGIQAIQFAKFSGCRPIIATASPRERGSLFCIKSEHWLTLREQHEYLQSLGADVLFDYRDKEIVNKLKGTVSGVKLQLAFKCVGASTEVLEQVVEPGGSIILALPPTSQSSTHHVEMAIAGTVHDLESFRAPDFKFHKESNCVILMGLRS
ncbi:hypothetical protein BJX62DRAFT_244033 [Aspergillus germanicus]